MQNTWDVIVLGAGGFGSSALFHLAQRGLRVLGLEQFSLVHDRGSSHGETRIIRKAYFEHADYVPLLERGYELWAELESLSGKKLFEKVGLFLAGHAGSEVVTGTWSAAQQHRLPVERMSPDESRRRFSGFQFADEDVVLFEQDAGFLRVEDCVRTHLEQAQKFGAEIRGGEPALSWRTTSQGVEVRTAKATYSANRLVMAAGSWTGPILRELNLPLRILRKVPFWYRTSADQYLLSDGSPCFFFERPTGQFYGFPSIDGSSVKLAEHTGGNEIVDPAQVCRDLLPEDLQNVGPFVKDSLPNLRDPLRHSVCLYTCSPDGHFIIDRHPEFPQVVFGAGFSGHGFKFTSVIGSILADLAIEGGTALPIDFLGLNRPALRRF